jgi:hypothetical protein
MPICALSTTQSTKQRVSVSAQPAAQPSKPTAFTLSPQGGLGLMNGILWMQLIIEL